jgi:mitogen-activated protein kinase kinase kinase
MVNSSNGSNPLSASSTDLNSAQQQYTNVNNPVSNANHSHRHTAGPKGRRPSLLRNDSSSNSVYTPSNTAGDGSTPMHSSHLKWGSSGTGNNNASSTAINDSHNSTNANSTSLLTPSSNKRQTSHNNSGNNTLSSTGGRARSRSITQTLSHNLQNNNKQYLSQEKAYLKKMKNQFVDDYYTKGITGAEMKEVNNNDEDEDEDEDETNPNGHSDLLADMDDDKYQIDYNLAFTLLKNGKNAININPNRNITQLNADSADDPAVIERLEWQSMLTSVLTGDVVRSEKTKIINNNSPENEQSSFLHATYKENLWFGIHAKLFNRTEDDQRKIIEYRRTLADALFDEVLNFEVNHDDPESNPPRNQVAYILDKYDKCCDLWRTLEDMKNEKPVCRTAEFQDRIDALTAWLSITDAMQRESDSLKVWIGNDEMDITKSRSESGSAPSSEATTPTNT